MIELPDYARVVRVLGRGEHPYLELLPRVAESPAMRRIETPGTPLEPLLNGARVRLVPGDGFVWVDDELPAIILNDHYYRTGRPLDLYLDLVHELVHLRQLAEGHDLWDDRHLYENRPTEIEAYAIAIEEGRRLGMTEADIHHHLSNPWMSPAAVERLRRHIDKYLAKHPIGHGDAESTEENVSPTFSAG